MNLAAFVAAGEPRWRELGALLSEAERRDGAVASAAEARRLVELHRRACVDLVQARTYGAGYEMVAFLEVLVGRGHALLHPPPPLRVGRGLWSFFRDTFPGTLRRERAAFGLVLAAFVLGLGLGGLATAFDAEAHRLFVPVDHQRERPSERVARDESATSARQLDPGSHAAFSAFLFTHNIGVSLTAFAVGLAFGLPTLLLIAWHGAFLAALAVEYARDGEALFFFAWILPHGGIELTCMLIAGTAGLLLGRGVLWPRGRARGVAVRDEARTGLVLLGGCAALLVVAGVVEGTISQIHEPRLPYELKLAFAAVAFTLLHAWLWLLPVHSTPRDLSSR